MAQYIVTITPVLGEKDAGEESSRTTMRVFAEDGQVYIKELTVRVAEDVKLGAADLLQVDLDLLMQAFAAKRPAAAAATTESSDAARPYRAVTPSRVAKSDRAYRRMPDPSELKDIYLKNRTVTGVAKHYGVPTHTAQGWITRLRRKGVIPSAK
ncbi:hypothetical protein JMF97_27155 [Micromonospora fiedleri]|uniref:Helix-turn-helix domain-containing protein n=1 Tax=Micromonospora fiedleri TaxID=1157498 RepID=A0ABS1UTZ6_9ACTN|nr:hypothetical protein [Micromonospora fiedleri]